MKNLLYLLKYVKILKNKLFSIKWKVIYMNKNKIEKKEENKSRINKFDRIRILKMILAILGILVCIVLSIYLFKIMKTLYSSEGQEMFKESFL